MNKNKVLLIFLSFMSACYAFAQEENDTTQTSVSVERTNLIIIDSQNNDANNDVIETLNKTIKELRRDVNQKDLEIAALNNKIAKLKGHLIFADSIVARLSNDCLRNKYEKTAVDNALHDFDNMYSVELRSKFSPLKSLLINYGKYTTEITSIFSAAESDIELNNLFTGQKKALTYIEQIKRTTYYSKIYNQNWTIPYLNRLIDSAIEKIEAYNPKEKKGIQLLELIK